MFKLANDPLFVSKIRDIVGLYMDPPDKALVLCVEEKSQMQALERTHPLLPLRPRVGLAKRRGFGQFLASPSSKILRSCC